MRNTIIVLIVLVVAVVFYWQFFVPATPPTAQIDLPAETSSSGQDASAQQPVVPEQEPR